MVYYVHVEKGQVFESITSLPLPLPLPIFLFILYIYFLIYFSFGNARGSISFRLRFLSLSRHFLNTLLHHTFVFVLLLTIMSSKVELRVRGKSNIYILSLKPYREEDPPTTPLLFFVPFPLLPNFPTTRRGVGRGKKKKEKGKGADLPFSHTLAFRKSLLIFIWFNILSLLTWTRKETTKWKKNKTKEQQLQRIPAVWRFHKITQHYSTIQLINTRSFIKNLNQFNKGLKSLRGFPFPFHLFLHFPPCFRFCLIPKQTIIWTFGFDWRWDAGQVNKRL